MKGVVNYVDSHIFSLFKASSLSYSSYVGFAIPLTCMTLRLYYTILSRKPLKDNSNIEKL
jgi:hypothetical protein